MLTNLPGVFHVAAGWSLCSHSGQTLLLSSSQALEALGWGGGGGDGGGEHSSFPLPEEGCGCRVQTLPWGLILLPPAAWVASLGLGCVAAARAP